MFVTIGIPALLFFRSLVVRKFCFRTWVEMWPSSPAIQRCTVEQIDKAFFVLAFALLRFGRSVLSKGQIGDKQEQNAE